MKIIAGVAGAAALLMLAPTVVAQSKGGGPKGVRNYNGYVPHQKTGGNHPGGHSSTYGHKKNAPGGSYAGGGSSGEHVHNSSCGHTCTSCGNPPPKKVYRCFPPGHCKSINDQPKGYYGPPGQKGR